MNETNQNAQDAGQAESDRPIVLGKSKGGKKKKKKYSRGLKRVQRFEARLSKGGRRLSRAVTAGFNRYVSQGNKSARRRRDGRLVDFYENVARGVSRGISRGGPAIEDVARAFNTKRLRRQIRAAARGSIFPFI